MRWQPRFYFLILLNCLLLSGCGSLTHRMQSHVIHLTDYPEADCLDKSLVLKPPTIDLSRYRSVQQRPGQDPSIAIAVAASGGGYRASNLTTGVLLGLEQIQLPGQHHNLLQEVDYYSTASGGGFAIGYYLKSLYAYLKQDRAPGSFSLQNQVQLALQRTAQDGTNDLNEDYSDHLFFGQARGLELENALDQNTLSINHQSMTLGDIFVAKESNKTPMLPYWAANSTVYQNAAILSFTPDVLTRYQVTQYHHRLLPQTLKGSFSDSTYAYDMPIAVGLTASASYPFVIPATTLTSHACKEPCYLHLFDGGLSDNLAVYTAVHMLHQDHAATKVLIIIDAANEQARPFSRSNEPPSRFDLFNRLVSMLIDSPRERIRGNIHHVARDVLCHSGAKQVQVIYLNLSDHPEAREIGTGMYLTPEQQILLLNLGQDMVRANPGVHKLQKWFGGKKTLINCK